MTIWNRLTLNHFHIYSILLLPSNCVAMLISLMSLFILYIFFYLLYYSIFNIYANNVMRSIEFLLAYLNFMKKCLPSFPHFLPIFVDPQPKIKKHKIFFIQISYIFRLFYILIPFFLIFSV